MVLLTFGESQNPIFRGIFRTLELESQQRSGFGFGADPAEENPCAFYSSYFIPDDSFWTRNWKFPGKTLRKSCYKEIPNILSGIPAGTSRHLLIFLGELREKFGPSPLGPRPFPEASLKSWTLLVFAELSPGVCQEKSGN